MATRCKRVIGLGVAGFVLFVAGSYRASAAHQDNLGFTPEPAHRPAILAQKPFSLLPPAAVPQPPERPLPRPEQLGRRGPSKQDGQKGRRHAQVAGGSERPLFYYEISLPPALRGRYLRDWDMEERGVQRLIGVSPCKIIQVIWVTARVVIECGDIPSALTINIRGFSTFGDRKSTRLNSSHVALSRM